MYTAHVACKSSGYATACMVCNTCYAVLPLGVLLHVHARVSKMCFISSQSSGAFDSGCSASAGQAFACIKLHIGAASLLQEPSLRLQVCVLRAVVLQAEDALTPKSKAAPDASPRPKPESKSQSSSNPPFPIPPSQDEPLQPDRSANIEVDCFAWSVACT